MLCFMYLICCFYVYIKDVSYVILKCYVYVLDCEYNAYSWYRPQKYASSFFMPLNGMIDGM